MSERPHDLDALTRALRDAHDLEASADGALGRRRLERALVAEHRTKRRRVGVYVLLAASFVGLTAWAGTTGRLPRAVRYLESLATTEEPPPVSAPLPTFEPPAPAPFEPPPSAPPAPPPAPAPAPEPARVPSRLPSSSPPPTPDPDALYREASAAHFDRKDYALALAAWDRYLAAAGPAGRFTVEARYSRAIALLRLGRREEARTALEPFARGEYGGYRRDDATRLVDSLR